MCKSNIGQQRIFIAGIQEVVGLEKLSAAPVFNFFHTAIEIIRAKKPGKTFAEHEMPQKRPETSFGKQLIA